MDFHTEVESGYQKYNLQVLTSNVEPEGEYPKSIFVSVCISKIVAGEKYNLDNIILKYTTKSREYIVLYDDNYLDEYLYRDVIHILGSSYSDLWTLPAN